MHDWASASQPFRTTQSAMCVTTTSMVCGLPCRWWPCMLRSCRRGAVSYQAFLAARNYLQLAGRVMGSSMTCGARGLPKP